MGFATLPLGSRSLPSGKSRTSEWEVARRRVGSRVAASGVSKSRIVSFLYDIISSLQTRRTTRREQVARLSKTGRWALALRPEHHPRSDQSGHVEQPACRTRCPKEPHAQRSWHLQRSLPAQSEDLRTEVWLAESLRRRGARRGASDCAALEILPTNSSQMVYHPRLRRTRSLATASYPL